MGLKKVSTKKVSTEKNSDTVTISAAELAQLQAAAAGKANQKNDSGDEMPEFTTEPGTIIYFPGGPPPEKYRTMLKNNRFTFRNAIGSSGQPAWVGATADLKNTPFDVK